MEIFVFGSNLAGRHGAGSARQALRFHGAKYGVGVGLHGSSYAIPTKDGSLHTLPLSEIERYVMQFKKFAYETSGNFTFKVVAIGCGLAGYKPSQIGPMFKGCGSNVKLPPEFLPFV